MPPSLSLAASDQVQRELTMIGTNFRCIWPPSDAMIAVEAIKVLI
jgi:hypothetical protein